LKDSENFLSTRGSNTVWVKNTIKISKDINKIKLFILPFPKTYNGIKIKIKNKQKSLTDENITFRYSFEKSSLFLFE
jgi:hypothetical protein